MKQGILLAKLMLCVPATSSAAERVFSAAGITVSKRRSCLKPENIDRILFLNNFGKYDKFFYIT